LLQTPKIQRVGTQRSMPLSHTKTQSELKRKSQMVEFDSNSR